MHPPEAALSYPSPEQVIKKPVVDPFPSLSQNSPLPQRAHSLGMKQIDTCAQYIEPNSAYKVNAQLCLSIFIEGDI